MHTIDSTICRRAHRVERYDTIIVGGGQAGLATGYYLAKRDADFLILDGAARTGDSWRQRWDSLRLFTPARRSGLPGFPFPALPSYLPDKDEVADYLERYAERFDLPIRHSTRVESMIWDGARYVLDTGAVRYEANAVVVATGPFQSPRTPSLTSELAPHIHQLHSSEYVSPLQLPPGPALVVGAGNSGAQIALELARLREVTLAGKAPDSPPRTALGRDIYDWVWPVLTHLTASTPLGKRLRRRTAHADPLVGTTPRQLIRAGIRRVGRVTEVRDGLPVANGLALPVSVVIWATGFAPDFRWIQVPLPLEHGYPVTRRGVVPESPGLYFVGQRWEHRLTSALLGGVGVDAEYIAGLIDR